nr:MAG TPA: hypothetical protein [Caudoviricetes sp.]
MKVSKKRQLRVLIKMRVNILQMKKLAMIM